MVNHPENIGQKGVSGQQAVSMGLAAGCKGGLGSRLQGLAGHCGQQAARAGWEAGWLGGLGTGSRLQGWAGQHAARVGWAAGCKAELGSRLQGWAGHGQQAARVGWAAGRQGVWAAGCTGAGQWLHGGLRSSKGGLGSRLQGGLSKGCKGGWAALLMCEAGRGLSKHISDLASKLEVWFWVDDRVATKWVSGHFAKYEIGRNKTFFSRNFGGIPRNSAEGFCQNFAYFREILLLVSRNFAV